MYSDDYGFTGEPFQLAPDPGAFFESLSHRQALASLRDGLAQGEGVMVLSGLAGTGKTTLVARLIATVDRDSSTVAQMVSGELDGGQTIAGVARAFGLAIAPIVGLAAETRNPLALDALLSFLREESRCGRRCLLVVDEAQGLSNAALEILRQLANFQAGAHVLLQILLIGQPEFHTRLQCDPELERLRQRVILSQRLDPLAPDEVERYLHHRLACVGWMGHPSFEQDLLAELHAATGGVPARINRVAHRLLRLAAGKQQGHIDRGHLAQVLAEWKDCMPPLKASPEPGPGPWLEAALACCEAQIAGLQRAIMVICRTGPGDTAHPRLDDALQERLANLESRVIEQERTIRHTLTMLIEWIERDESRCVAA